MDTNTSKVANHVGGLLVSFFQTITVAAIEANVAVELSKIDKLDGAQVLDREAAQYEFATTMLERFDATSDKIIAQISAGEARSLARAISRQDREDAREDARNAREDARNDKSKLDDERRLRDDLDIARAELRSLKFTKSKAVS